MAVQWCAVHMNWFIWLYEMIYDLEEKKSLVLHTKDGEQKTPTVHSLINGSGTLPRANLLLQRASFGDETECSGTRKMKHCIYLCNNYCIWELFSVQNCLIWKGWQAPKESRHTSTPGMLWVQQLSLLEQMKRACVWNFFCVNVSQANCLYSTFISLL